MRVIRKTLLGLLLAASIVVLPVLCIAQIQTLIRTVGDVNRTGKLRVYDGTNNYSDIQTGSISSNYTLTLPAATDTIVGRTTTDTLTNKTLTSPTLTTPAIGVATGTSLAVTGALTSSGTAGIGYATGAGGTVAQATDKSTGVTLSKTVGEITMDAAELAANTTVSFTLTNTTIGATDVLILNHASGGTVGAYTFNAQCAAGSAVINVRNVTAGALSEAVVIRFVVIKGVSS